MKKFFKLSSIITALIILAAAAAVAQEVNVTVNGVPVQFTGTKPLTQQGRVLVPLRGVLEKMGAFVDWVPATRTVTAQKGDLTVELPVGSKTSTVNGKQVALDVPAAIMAGSTMVPLRFLGEALGADVKWDAPSRTVIIATTGAVTPPPAHITSFSHDARGWLRTGSTISVKLTGAPGGQASFEIPGVMDSVKMKETSSGYYAGSWTIPANSKITVSGGTLIGMLKANGKEQLIQAGENVSIDTAVPKISDARPAADSRVAQAKPGISVVLDDGSGSGIDTSSVKITVNGTDVTNLATITPTLIAFKPLKDLPSGESSVAVEVRDMAGNPAGIAWKFAVKAASDVIKSFTHSDNSDLQPGDVLTVKLEGEQGGTARFSIVQDGQTLRTKAMRETSPGIYEGQYTIRRDDRLQGAVITGTLKTAAGETFSTETEDTISGNPQSSSAVTSPVITSPVEGAALKSPITIKGKAAPNASVKLRVSYVTMVLGMVGMKGVVTEQTVEADEKGQFASEPVKLGTLVKGKNTEYTITATTVAASGEESEPATVVFTGS